MYFIIINGFELGYNPDGRLEDPIGASKYLPGHLISSPNYFRRVHPDVQWAPTVRVPLAHPNLHRFLQLLRCLHHQVHVGHHEEGSGHPEDDVYMGGSDAPSLCWWEMGHAVIQGSVLASACRYWIETIIQILVYTHGLYNVYRIGFVFVVTGIFLYSDVLIMPYIRKRKEKQNTQSVTPWWGWVGLLRAINGCKLDFQF